MLDPQGPEKTLFCKRKFQNKNGTIIFWIRLFTNCRNNKRFQTDFEFCSIAPWVHDVWYQRTKVYSSVFWNLFLSITDYFFMLLFPYTIYIIHHISVFTLSFYAYCAQMQRANQLNLGLYHHRKVSQR